MSVQTLKKGKVKTQMFANLSLRQDELVELLFESFLLPRRSHDEYFPGTVYDASVQLYSNLGHGKKLKSSVFPMTTEEAEQHIEQIAVMQLFTEGKAYDQYFDEVRNRMRQECLFIEIDVWSEHTDRNSLPRLLQNFTTDAKNYTQRIVDRVQSYKTTKGT